MSPRISVIIPVYNTGTLLERCLQSISNQTFQDWEAVCVDDGSDDGITPEILERLAGEDTRIKVIHQSNAGVSAARNLAIRHAAGHYFLFVDSDDFLHPQTMEICSSMADRDGSDIVAFTYNRRYRTLLSVIQALRLPEKDPAGFKHYDIRKIQSVVTDNIFDYATEYSRTGNPWAVKHCQPWRCLYLGEAIRGLDFQEGIMYEDFPWWSRVLLNVRKATIINLPLYYYYPNFRGYTHSAPQQKRIKSLKTAIPLAQKAYENVTDKRRELWEANFLTPFQQKLARKEKH